VRQHEGSQVSAAVADEHGMREYCARRAHEYERIYAKPERQADLRVVENWLPGPFAGRAVLEIACGTGWWTPHGARDARSWLATDLNPQTLALARGKPMPACVRLAELDAFTFEGLAGQRFDAAFAGCWWSHVPLERLGGWLGLLHARLSEGARVVFLDNTYVHGSSTPISRRDAAGNSCQQRRLDDGSVHEVLKNFPTREQAIELLGASAHDIEWIEHRHYWRLSYLVN
jgi:demethylmenaquinone methyltransferase/2-methoxy-6-polyprenyl-1,4-benzoquinol methylase